MLFDSKFYNGTKYFLAYCVVFISLVPLQMDVLCLLMVCHIFGEYFLSVGKFRYTCSITDGCFVPIKGVP